MCPCRFFAGRCVRRMPPCTHTRAFCAICVALRPQTALMNPRNATKNSVNGPPKWVTLTTPSVISSEQRDTILSLSPTTSFLDWVKDTNPEIIDCLKKREDGGGGWSLGCSKLGKRSAITGDLMPRSTL